MIDVTQNGQYQVMSTDGSAQTVTIDDIPAAIQLNQPWQLTFQKNRDVPTQLTLNKLTSLTALKPVALQHYSGTISYETSFTLDKSLFRDDQHLQLDLGDVGVIASVTLNGKPLGESWSGPLTINLDDAAKAGENTFKVEVATTWINRFIGDFKYPEKFPDSQETKQFNTDVTFDVKMSKNDNLQPSGLMGPVTIKPIRKVAM